MKWNTGLYDQKHDFVSKYGEDVIHLLDPQAGEHILDLGCGTGDLAEMIRNLGAKVLGIDSSPEMITKAREKYPQIDFRVMSAESFQLEGQFDAVFSNATLHWVLEKEKAAECIYASLKKGGRFVAEFGGKGNIGNIEEALRSVLRKNGYIDQAEKKVWYFPSLAEYAALLEKKGFRITWAAHFDRETLLKENDGIQNWIYMFGKTFLEGIDQSTIDRILLEVEEQLRSTNFKNGNWYADYVRLRIMAIKEKHCF
ncbi:trans-aconitate 2-methyltransferase [Aquiflexum sp.]|uniref:class I SAM-dependent methyltransferase n=1 Tax=Aquiflexum sp. TaxID=1872584 RepID=UPI00359345C5